MPFPSSPLRLLLLASLTALVLTFVLSCDEEEYSPPLAVCTPALDALSPTSGPLSGGTEVTLHGLFIATELGVRDTRIQLDGEEAEILSVSRGEGCLACDQCILVALRCAECERVCRGENGWSDIDTGEWILPEVCEEQVSFITPPAAAPGPAGLILTTSRGSGVGLDFVYTAGDDDDSAGDDDDSAGDDDDSAGDDDDSAGDDDDSAGDDDDSAGDDDDSAGDDDDSAGDDDDSAL